MKIYETQTSGRISQRNSGIMLREDPEYIWIYDQAHTKDTLSPVFAKRCLLYSINLPIVMDNWQGTPFHWDADYAHRNVGGAFWYGPNGCNLVTGNGQLNMHGINPSVCGQSSYDPDYYYTCPFTNNDASGSLWRYKIHAPSGEVVNKSNNANHGSLIYFLHETEESYYGLNCYHHGSARFVRMEKSNSMTIHNKGRYNDDGNLLGPQILYKTDKAVIFIDCWHNSSTAMAFVVGKNYWTDTGTTTTTHYQKTSNDLTVTYTDWNKPWLRKSVFKLNQSGYEPDTMGTNSYVGMGRSDTKLLSDREEETQFDAKLNFHMHSLAATVHDHDSGETGLIKDHEMLRWYSAYCDEDGAFQILRFNMPMSDEVIAPTYDVRKCTLSNPSNLEAPTLDTIEANGQAYMGDDNRAQQGVQLAYFTDKKDGAYEHYLLMSFANIVGSNIFRAGSAPNYNYNKMYVYKITNKAEFFSNGASADEIDSLDLSLHQVIVEQDLAFGLLRPNFDAKTFVYCTRTDNHPVYIWNSEDQVFDKKTSITAQAINFASDSEGRIYALNYHKDDDFSIDMFTLDIPSKVLLEMDEYEYEYSGSTLDKEVRVKAINWKSELIEAKVNLKVVGSGVSLVDAGNGNAEVNTLEVTTDDSDWLTIPIKINSGSAVKINASISPN
tara:strand:+ start:2376 stop:4367 length:1992 start_codon:yes stop_codon:yes gene_type:complete